MVDLAPDKETNLSLRFKISRYRKTILGISSMLLILSFLGFATSWTNPEIRAPLRPGLDFTGGTQIQIERDCAESCKDLQTVQVEKALKVLVKSEDKESALPNLSGSRVQLLDRGKSIVLRLPFLSASQSKDVIEAVSLVAGPFLKGGQSVATIGPSLGGSTFKK